MASYNELLALIDAYINRNGVQAITGQILNGVLKAMVDQLGRGYTLMGYAEPTGDPGTPDGPESWFASVPGTYTNYGEIQVAAGELALLSFAPSEGWTKNTIYEGFREVTATADDNIGFPQVGVTYANGVLSFDFKNIKGEPGENGDPAGFGSVTASVDDQVGTPSVSVSSSGPDTAKNFAFAFHNLKGETGVTSVVATVDNTSGNPQCSVSLQGGQLTLAFTGLKGAQGNTGSSVDYPFTIVNNLTTNDPAQALSAAMGVELDGKVSQLEAEVNEVVQENNNVFNLSSATARDNSSANITWSVSDGTMTASTSVNTNQHLYLNLNGTTAGKRYKFSATVTNLAQPLLVKHIGSSNYEEATIDGTTYTAEFVSTGEDFLDFLFRNRTITMSDVSVRELPLVSVKPSAIGNLTFANMNAGAVALIPQMASRLSFVPANTNMPNAALNYDSTNDVIQIKNQTVICGITTGYKSASATNLTPLDTTTAQLVVYDVSSDLFKMAKYNAVLTDSEIIIASFRKTTSAPDKSSFATVLPWSVDGFLYNIRTIADVPKSRGFTKGINHRGYNGVAPENTIPAFKLSAKKGFVYVETDVRYTSDGVAVLLHDASINRTARNEDGTEISEVVNIADITYEDALDYDFGIWKDAAYAGTKIPTFEEFIILCRNLGLHPYIELKAGTQSQIEELVDVVEMHGMRGKVSWISGNSQYLGYVKDCDEQARLGYIEVPSSATISTAVSLRNGKNDVFMTSNSYTDAIVELCKAASMPLEVWTINTTAALALVPSYVSGVTSNSIDASVELYDTN